MKKYLVIICGLFLPCGFVLAQDFNLNLSPTEDDTINTGINLGGFDSEILDVANEKPKAEENTDLPNLEVEENNTPDEKLSDLENLGELDFSVEEMNLSENLIFADLLWSPEIAVDNKMPSTNQMPTWSWRGNSSVDDSYTGVFLYCLDDEKCQETTATSFTPDKLGVGRHTLSVQEKYKNVWTPESSAEVVVFPLDVSGTDYVSGLPTATAHTELLPLLIKFLIMLGGLVAFISFMYSGIWMIIFADHDDEIEKMKRNLTYSVVGLVVIGLAYSIVSGVLKLI